MRAATVADEPPYPLDGRRLSTRLITDRALETGARGVLRILIKVDADGKAVSATSIGDPHKELTTFAAKVLMLDRYKPAKRDGTPVPGVYSFLVDFGVLN